MREKIEKDLMRLPLEIREEIDYLIKTKDDPKVTPEQWHIKVDLLAEKGRRLNKIQQIALLKVVRKLGKEERK